MPQKMSVSDRFLVAAVILAATFIGAVAVDHQLYEDAGIKFAVGSAGLWLCFCSHHLRNK